MVRVRLTPCQVGLVSLVRRERFKHEQPRVSADRPLDPHHRRVARLGLFDGCGVRGEGMARDQNCSSTRNSTARPCRRTTRHGRDRDARHDRPPPASDQQCNVVALTICNISLMFRWPFPIREEPGPMSDIPTSLPMVAHTRARCWPASDPRQGPAELDALMAAEPGRRHRPPLITVESPYRR